MTPKEIAEYLKTLKTHSLFNISMSGNKVWSEAASKELEKRRIKGTSNYTGI